MNAPFHQPNYDKAAGHAWPATDGVRRRSGTRFPLIVGIASTVTLLALPAGIIELAVASAGLSEMLPAAAPPLGWVARGMVAIVGGLASVAIVIAVQRREDQTAPHISDGISFRDDNNSQGLSSMGSAFSKIAAFARGDGRRRPGFVAEDVLARRREDAHPDAPPRRPLFASQDLADFSSVRAPNSSAGNVFPISTGPAPVQPESIATTPVHSAAPRLSAYERPLNVPPTPPMPRNPAPLAKPPIGDMSLDALTARFEKGLQERAGLVQPPQPEYPAPAPVQQAPVTPAAAPTPTLAQMPVAPAAPVRPTVETAMDSALREALTALRSVAPGR